jgi:UDP-N-acetylmuramoyl-tripeptide--D-alanyl-D-alanine ligase
MEKLFNLFYECSGICTDTRKIEENSLFIALKGSNFNGNLFAEQAIKEGAKFAIVDEPVFSNDKNIFYTPDSLKFLQLLSNFHRKKFEIPVIGITGSNGKTTSKELINCVLSTKFNTLCTIGNLNNHIGVPLTLLRLNKNHEIAIIEMGANKPGDIQELVDIAEPNYGVITNIGKAHLEGFKTLEGVINTKSELFNFVKNHQGKIIYNSDDQIISDQLIDYDLKASYGKIKSSFVRGELLELNPFVKFRWQMQEYNSDAIQTNLVGSYNFYNFLAAISFGVEFQVSPDLINKAICSYIPTNNRSQVIKTQNNTLVMDCYNANPSSMQSALESFISNTQKNKLAILGDMLELGSESFIEHAKILEMCSDQKLNFITVGLNFQKVNPNGFESISDLENYLIKNPIKEKSILLKGSRGIALEKIVGLL